MDYFDKLRQRSRIYIYFILLATTVAMTGFWAAMHLGLGLDLMTSGLLTTGLVLAVNYLLAHLISRHLLEPFKLVRQAILHVSPDNSKSPAPKLDNLRFGRELVSGLVMQVYELASSSPASLSKQTKESRPGTDNFVLDNLPLPVLIMDKDQNIKYSNQAALDYLGRKAEDTNGKNLYSLMDMSFPNDDTYDKWLKESREHSATASQSWHHVRLGLPELKTPKQFDLAAYYNKDNPSGLETILTLFDRTPIYEEEDRGVSYVALAVHELRTPLTLLRGYIEVFEDELEGKLDAELQDFMRKMNASAQQLTAFVNNILNVSRVEADQMVLHLSEHNWADILTTAVADMNLRAKIHNKTIELQVADKLPAVGVDRVSVYEVVTNLLDNAIKYSGGSDKILVSSVLTKDGIIETTVRDWGVGIPESVISKLFEKFYRNHRTQAQIGGTGLGLYLSKAIIEAHGGNIWVKSKEGEGTSVSFTLQPYVMVAQKLKSSDNRGITRGAHGWIKNHSMYRR